MLEQSGSGCHRHSGVYDSAGGDGLDGQSCCLGVQVFAQAFGAKLSTRPAGADPTVESRRALVDVLDRLIPALKEHLNTEEDRVVPLMEQQITAAEWNEFLQNESAAVDPDHLPLMLGMLMYEGDPESVEQVIASMSADAGPVIRRLAAPTFAAHSQRVHGTATPPRSTEL